MLLYFFVERLFVVLAFFSWSCLSFGDVRYEDIVERSQRLKGGYAHVNTALELWNVANAHSNAHQKTTSCSPLVVEVSDVQSLAEDVTRPQVLISGEIHGDERVGPAASLFTAELLVWAAECVVHHKDAACNELAEAGIMSQRHRQWLAYLATTRDTFFIPTTNCLGYMLNQREDAGVDPNRDFSYDRRDNRCMQSSTAKVLNALFAHNMIQLVVTFHGGMVALAYEWGTYTHNPAPKDISPDHEVHSSIANTMKTFSSTFKGEVPYPVGTMNKLVYPVHGGMEDWVYAAGWDTNKRHNCTSFKPVPHSVYPQDGFGNDIATDNRAVVFLVETSNNKHPHANTWGQKYQIFNNSKANTANGHVPRNVRISLNAVDVAEPYVCVEVLSWSNSNDDHYMEKEKASIRTEGRTRRSLLTGASTSTTKPVKIKTTSKSVSLGGVNSHKHPHHSSGKGQSKTGGGNGGGQHGKYHHNHKRKSKSTGGGNTVGLEKSSKVSHHREETATASTVSVVEGEGSRHESIVMKLSWSVGGVHTVDHSWVALHTAPAAAAAASWTHRDTRSYLHDHGPTTKDPTAASHLRRPDTQQSDIHSFHHHHHHPDGTLYAPLSFTHLTATRDKGYTHSTAGSVAPERLRAHKENEDINPLKPYLFSSQLKVTTTGGSFAEISASTAASTDSVKVPNGDYWVVMWTQVDSNWGGVKSYTSSPMTAPQSHLANARSNGDWNRTYPQADSTTKRFHMPPRTVLGHLYWPSDPIHITIGHAQKPVTVTSAVMNCAWWSPVKEVYHSTTSNSTSYLSSSLLLDQKDEPMLETRAVDAVHLVDDAVGVVLDPVVLVDSPVPEEEVVVKTTSKSRSDFSMPTVIFLILLIVVSIGLMIQNMKMSRSNRLNR